MFEIALALTLHFSNVDYNEVNPHVRLEHEGLILGAYKNSFDTTSSYIGYKHRFDKNWIEGGIVTGYTTAPVLPFVRIGRDIFPNVRVFVAPGTETRYDDNNETTKIIGITGIEFFVSF